MACYPVKVDFSIATGVFISLEILKSFFKPETRHSGETLYSKGQVTATRPADNEVQAYIRGTTTYKINFVAESISSEIITAKCSCALSQKGQLCKHIWAGLLKTEDSNSDFLDGKKHIEKQSLGPSNSQHQETLAKNSTISKSTFTAKPLSETQLAANANFKEKQKDYRKLQYQKQKLFQKQKKSAEKKNILESPDQPLIEVTQALSFFSANGFPLSVPGDLSVLNLAKKKLSRVFHPDAGGTHDEILELNKNFDVLINYIKKNAQK